MASEEIPLQLTRSKTSLFIKVLFCDGQWVSRESPFTVSSPSITQSLRTAIENSGNDRLRVKLGTSVHTSNEQDSGIRYHKVCWVNNVHKCTVQAWPGNYSKQWLCPIYKQHIHASILEANNVHETVCNQNSKFWYSWTSLQRSPWEQNKVAVVMSQCMDFSPPGRNKVAFVER